MTRKLASAFAAALLGVGLIATMPATAQAGHKGASITIQGSHGSITIGERRLGKRYKHRDRYYGYRDFCRPGEARHKAKRMGLRRAYIDRVGKRLIVVEGRRHGNFVRVAFRKHSPHCRVAWVDRIPARYGGGHRW